MTDLVVFAERLNLFQTNRPWPVSSTTRSWNEALGGDVNWFDRFAAQHAVRGPGVSGPTRWWRLDKPKDDPLNIATSNKGSGIAIFVARSYEPTFLMPLLLIAMRGTCYYPPQQKNSSQNCHVLLQLLLCTSSHMHNRKLYIYIYRCHGDQTRCLSCFSCLDELLSTSTCQPPNSLHRRRRWPITGSSLDSLFSALRTRAESWRWPRRNLGWCGLVTSQTEDWMPRLLREAFKNNKGWPFPCSCKMLFQRAVPWVIGW